MQTVYDLVKILDALPDLFPSRQQAVKFGLYQFHNCRDGARRPSKGNGIGSQLCCHVHGLSAGVQITQQPRDRSSNPGMSRQLRSMVASSYVADATGELEPIKIS